MTKYRKKILQVNIDNNGGNGAFTLIRYLYSFLRDEFEFDYYTMGTFVNNSVYQDIIKDGGICQSANLRRNKLIGHIELPFKFFMFLKSRQYEVVHIHSEMAYKQFLYAIAAKSAGIKKIIIHSHSSDIDGNNKKIKFIAHKIFRFFVNKLGTDFLACSKPAAEWMFNEKILKGTHFNILHNGINPYKYKYSEETRNRVREELNLQNKTVIGHVGALKKVKNQSYLLNIISKMNLQNYELILVGDGDDRKILEKKAKELKCENNVLFLGNRTDVNRILMAIDIFVFPSLFEGIPLSLIEAQAVGVPIVASNQINHEIKVNKNVYFLPIEEKNINGWCEYIEKMKEQHIKMEGYKNISDSLFNIKKSADYLRNIYK